LSHAVVALEELQQSRGEDVTNRGAGHRMTWVGH